MGSNAECVREFPRMVSSWKLDRFKKTGTMGTCGGREGKKMPPCSTQLVNLVLIDLRPDKGSAVPPAMTIDCNSVGETPPVSP